MFTTTQLLGDYKPALFNAVIGKREALIMARRDPERTDEWHRRAVNWDYRAKDWAAIIIGRHC